MTPPLRLLILEDQPADAELVVLQLERAGFAPRWQRVETEREFISALGPELELILADYQLPHYDALRALAHVRECGVGTPFIIVSGNIGEELAVSAMQQGAADFIIKDRLGRLGSAVARALEQRRLREENRLTHETLRRSEELSRRVFDLAGDLKHLTPSYEKLSALARALAVTPEQDAAVEAADAPVREYLEARTGELLEAFTQFPERNGSVVPSEIGDNAHATRLLTAVQDTIGVLEQTKRSFKSRAGPVARAVGGGAAQWFGQTLAASAAMVWAVKILTRTPKLIYRRQRSDRSSKELGSWGVHSF